MGSRSRFKIKVPNRRDCVRCHKPIMNTFSKKPWCSDCDLELQQMSFDGTEVLDMIINIMPPTPPFPEATIKAWTVLKIARRVLLEQNLLLPNEDTEDEGGAPVPKSPILTT